MIKRMQIPRQLYNEGGISSVPLNRENFGLGSKFKKFVRKIIPKEIAQVAVKAAPFVAPFNPAIAGAMSGLGTFQQTGRIGKSLTAGGLNYAGGQAARYLGGAGFQGNPFTGGGAFTPSGFTGGFSSPFGTDTGLGKFLSDRRVARQPITSKGPMGDPMWAGQQQPSVISQGPMGDPMWSGQPERWSPGIQHSGAPQFPNQPPPSILSQRPSVPAVHPREMLEQAVSPEVHRQRAIRNVIRPSAGGGADFMEADTFTKALPKGVAETASEAIDKGPSIWEKVKTLNPLSKDFDFTKAGDTITDLGGKALSAVFRKEDGSLDKTAIMAALVTVPTFFEARALANEAGLGADEFTEEMFTAAKADSKKTYESNLGSFFEGTGYTGNLAKGGLIKRNYAFGSPDEFPEDDDLTIFEIIKEQGIPVGEQVRNKKIDVGAKSIQLAKITDKQRQQMEHDISYLTSGATDLQTVYENTKAWDDEGSKGFWGMGKKEAEPMTKEEFQEEMIKRGYLNIKNKSIEDFDRLKIKKGGRIGYQMGDVVKTAASEDAPFNQQRVLLDDLDQSGGVSSIFGGPSELEEAEYKSERLDRSYKRGDMQLALAKKLRKENPDLSTKEIWNEIRKLINRETEPLLYAQGGRIGYEDGSGIFGKKIKWENLNKDQKKWLRENQHMHNMKIPSEEKAQGGRIGYQEGTHPLEQKLHDLADYYMQRGLSESEAYETAANKLYKKDGGRIGFDEGTDISFIHRDKIRKAYDMAEKSAEAEDINIDDEMEDTFSSFFKNKRIRKALIEEGHDPDKIMRELLVEQMKSETGDLPSYALGDELQGYSDLFRKGGRAGYALGTPQASEGGLGGLPVEADMRYTGGFMPYGEKEKGDDVPARLSKNEFVFTADAVRAAGGGSMQKGAQRMYNTMKMLEGQMA